ncbi:glycosyltransferase [Demequina sp.]|uniref:glycosyltransferase n=1 Tax=Demequina sp. TaxID=2050685 RepID=UPI0025BFAFB8|nr:glycosyltransferase [Demequina sp.]
MTPRLAVMNPLPDALAHYERELRETLSRVGEQSVALDARPVEGLEGVLGKARMFANAIHNESVSRDASAAVLTTWPSLGLLDARLVSARRNPRVVILHDPVPLRQQVGFGRTAREWASRARQGRRPTILLHSDAAHREASRLLPRHALLSALHPMLNAAPPTRTSQEPVILVAGQFKPARDLELLAAIGPKLRKSGLRPQIVGRGWPDIDGWETDARFVPETELDDLLASASMVLLPYSHYFQSGIAVRALENATPTLGARTGFLEDLLGDGFEGLVDSSRPEEYVERAKQVATVPQPDVIRLLDNARARVDDSWRLLVDSLGANRDE